MRGHIHALSTLPFPHWSARFYEIDAQSSTLRLWHDEAASGSTREAPRQCTPLYLVDAATIEMPPPKSAFAARLVLTLCKGTAEQTTISFAHEERGPLHDLQAAIPTLTLTPTPTPTLSLTLALNPTLTRTRTQARTRTLTLTLTRPPSWSWPAACLRLAARSRCRPRCDSPHSAPRCRAGS